MTEEDYSIYYNEEDEFGGGEEEPVPSEEIEVEEEEEDLERPRQPVVKRRVKATVKKSPGAMGKFEITDLVSRRAIDLEHDAPPSPRLQLPFLRRFPGFPCSALSGGKLAFGPLAT